MKHIKLTIVFILLFSVMFNCIVINCQAHPDAREHDKELMAVLFGRTETYTNSPDTENYIKAIKYASNLAIDQFGGSGKEKYKELKRLKMRGIPSKFSDIDYKYEIPGGTRLINANTHRRYTHQGWIIEFGNSEANKFWNTRRKVLLGTVNTIFEFNKMPIVLQYDKKCEYLCGIIYYVHLLGDYDEADSYKKLSFLVPLAGSNDGVDMISNLKEYIEFVFDEKKPSSDYNDLMNGLDKIEKKAKRIQRSTGGVNTDEEFKDYHEYAKEVLDLLIKHMPVLLKNEEFFRRVFYPNITR